jgi:hypothetical protein
MSLITLAGRAAAIAVAVLAVAAPAAQAADNPGGPGPDGSFQAATRQHAVTGEVPDAPAMVPPGPDPWMVGHLPGGKG